MIKNHNRSPQSAVMHEDFGGGPVIGNPETFFGQAFIGFVDLLGFSTGVRLNWSDKKDSPLDRLLRIKESADKSQAKLFGFYTKTESDRPQVTKAFKSRVHTVSDSIVICSAYDTNPSFGDYCLQLVGVLCTTLEVWRDAINEGFTIRGAVECGPIYWSVGETVGPAFLDAYALESKMAKWSRVIIGPSLLQHITQLPAQLFRQVGAFLRVSSDGLIELSPSPHLVEYLQRIEEMNAAAEHSRDKYEPLLNILRSGRSTSPPTVDDLKGAVTAIHCDPILK